MMSMDVNYAPDRTGSRDGSRVHRRMVLIEGLNVTVLEGFPNNSLEIQITHKNRFPFLVKGRG
ncbi:MAG: hypothetical protein ACE5D7_10170 [Fidelibacterota bacterium]